jgi:hypothetical protein
VDVVLEYALSLARDLAHSWPLGPHQYYLCATPPSCREGRMSWREDVVDGGCRGGRMSWREDVPIWVEGMLYLEITSLLFWVKFEMGNQNRSRYSR